MSDSVLEALHGLGIRRASAEEPMARHTSWKIGGPADYFCVVETEQQLAGAVQVAAAHGIPWLVLGGGYNVLVADAGIEGIVILNRLRDLQIDTAHADPVLRCGAGVFFARAAQETARRGFTGMEWGISIPGTVGGGVVNNAGAHWSDVSRSLIDAVAIDESGGEQLLTLDTLAYRYRGSALKLPLTSGSRVAVVSCRFRLQPGNAAESLQRVEELRLHRLRTQPVKEASAGSTFKNPAGDHAGALIDRVGLKGHVLGGAQIAPLHANFILNVGGATASDVINLIRLAQSTVHEQCGVTLEPEVQLVGRWPHDMLHSLASPAA